MSKLLINKDKCVGCGLCIKSCAAGALSLDNKKAKVNDNCILCGVCAQSCPLHAISIEKSNSRGMDTSLYDGIWVFAEQHGGQVLPVAYELLSKGKELSGDKGCKLTALLFGDNIQDNIEKLFLYGADRVIFCENTALADNLEENYIELFDSLINEYKPDILLFGATGFGRSLAPRVAARVRTGLTADCTMLETDRETGLLKQTRPAFGGNLMATIICPNHRPQMATVRPGIFPAKDIKTLYKNGSIPYDKNAVISVPMPEITKNNIRILEEVVSSKVNSIEDAEIIVSVGRGIGSQKNIGLAKRLAELIGGSVGVSRPLVDIGWSEYKNQIGQTGSTVAPRLLIACGISGAVQHLAGIRNSDTIIAINTDPDAPIFSVANYKVVGDCVEILKKLNPYPWE